MGASDKESIGLGDNPSYSYAEYIKSLKDKLLEHKERIQMDFTLNFNSSLMEYHNTVGFVYNNEVVSYFEYEKLPELEKEYILNNGGIYFPSMKRTSFNAKYNLMKKFIDEGEYKQLL